MIDPAITYAKQEEKDKLRKDIFFYFHNKYIKYPFSDNGFMETTERFLARKLTFFLPGRIYIWQYDPQGKDSMSYYDARPLVLVNGQYKTKDGNILVQGLNLNLLPEKARVQLLSLYYNTFKSDFVTAEKAIDAEKLGTLNRVWQYLTNWYFVMQLFNSKGKIGYQWAVRTYAIDRINMPVLIELEDWDKIPYYVGKETHGLGLATIWSTYITERNKLSEKKSDPKTGSQHQKKFIRPGS